MHIYKIKYIPEDESRHVFSKLGIKNKIQNCVIIINVIIIVIFIDNIILAIIIIFVNIFLLLSGIVLNIIIVSLEEKKIFRKLEIF